MGRPRSVTTENSEPRQQGRAGPRGTPTAATDGVDASYSDNRFQTVSLGSSVIRGNPPSL